MGVGKFGRFVALPFSLLALGLLSAPVYADGITVRIPACVRAGGVVVVPAGSTVTLVSGWAMATRGNTQAFSNAATGIMTVNGQTVTPVKSDLIPLPVDFEPYDGWRVDWSFTTTAPALPGQTMIVTFIIVLSRQVADHEGGQGQPFLLQPGPLGGGPTGQDPFTCTLTAT